MSTLLHFATTRVQPAGRNFVDTLVTLLYNRKCPYIRIYPISMKEIHNA